MQCKPKNDPALEGNHERETTNPRSNTMNIKSFKTIIFSAAIMLTAMLGTNPAFAQVSWANSDTTWPPEATQEWSIGSNWLGGAAPADNQGVRLARWTGSEQVAAFILLDTDSNIATQINSGYGTKLHIGSSGNSRLLGVNQGVPADSGRFGIGAFGGSGDYVSIASGGQISWVDPNDPVDGTPTQGFLQLSNNATLDTAGTIKVPLYFNITPGSTMNINGGIIEAHRTWDSIYVYGSLNQSGGVIQNTPQLNLAIGTYTISGGSITADDVNALAFHTSTPTDGGTIHVDGSGASSISFSGMRYWTTQDRDNAVWKFTLDNGANHITPVTLTAVGTSGATLRDGATLDVGLKGGVLLSDSVSYGLITRPIGTYTDTWGTGPGPLWTHDAFNEDGVNKIRVTLVAGANKGTLNRGASLAVASSAYGYVNLSGVALNEPLKLQLDISGGTPSNLTDALTAADITWQAGSGGYDVLLTLYPATSGGTYFAWDLSDIDAAMSVTGLQIVPKGTVVSIQ